MENELVHSKKADVFCDSRVIAEKLGKQHTHVLEKIRKLKTDLDDSENENFREKIFISRGQKYPYIEMDVSSALLLLMEFVGKKGLVCKRMLSELLPYSVEFANKLISAIENFDMEEDLPERYIYAASDSQGNIKIGISRDPRRRIKDLNVGNPYKLELVFTKEAINPHYQDETALHAKFKDNKLCGEWFYLPKFNTDNLLPQGALL